MKNLPLYVTNDCNYFFEIDCEIDTDKLKGCLIHSSKSEMFNYLIESDGYQLDEIDGQEITFLKGEKSGKIVEVWNGTLQCSDIKNLESYISDFRL